LVLSGQQATCLFSGKVRFLSLLSKLGFEGYTPEAQIFSSHQQIRTGPTASRAKTKQKYQGNFNFPLLRDSVGLPAWPLPTGRRHAPEFSDAARPPNP
jgi:hypothetical protein